MSTPRIILGVTGQRPQITPRHLRAAAKTLRQHGHPEVALYLGAKANWLTQRNRAKADQLAEDLAKCADPNDEGASVG
jgi:CTP:molybdopterin cytidylyltransferase MocA